MAYNMEAIREHRDIATRCRGGVTLSDSNTSKFKLAKEGEKDFPLLIPEQNFCLFNKSHTSNNSITNPHGAAIRVIDFFQDSTETVEFIDDYPSLHEDELLLHPVHKFKLITNKIYTPEQELKRIDEIIEQNRFDFEENKKEFEEHKKKLKEQAEKDKERFKKEYEEELELKKKEKYIYEEEEKEEKAQKYIYEDKNEEEAIVVEKEEMAIVVEKEEEEETAIVVENEEEEE